ncbi:MAG TPA: biotin/lipoyl-containing protein [Ktedonobacterales bacterium]|nr:biotin/lipoyl-containing protein [Ktedonobacterales bacterium]
MPTEITVPQLGESIVEATVGQWRKQEGDAVAAGEPLVELETDKVNIEVSAPDDGVLTSILKHEGDTVAVGETLARVSGAQEQPARKASSAKSAAQPTAAASNGAAIPSTTAAVNVETTELGDGSRATPLARRIAAERHIDLQEISGTGSGGKITQDDVEAYLAGHEHETTATAAQAIAPAPAMPPSPPMPLPAPITPAAPATLPLIVESRR